MKLSNLLCAAALALAVALVGCATSTEFNGVWVNPDAGQRVPVKNVMVVAINRDPTARRIYEDTMVAQLATRGVKAQASYKLFPADVMPSPPVIEAAVRDSAADSLLVSRVLRETTDLHITPRYSYGPGALYGMFGSVASVAPDVYTVQKVVIDTRLFHVKDFVVLWSGTSTTQPSSSMEKTIAEFGTLLGNALNAAKVI